MRSSGETLPPPALLSLVCVLAQLASQGADEEPRAPNPSLRVPLGFPPGC